MPGPSALKFGSYPNFRITEVTIVKFIYRDEKLKFDRTWEKTAKYYAEQGMSQEQIDAMYDFDWKAFKADPRPTK